jgi:hypothetical protein
LLVLATTSTASCRLAQVTHGWPSISSWQVPTLSHRGTVLVVVLVAAVEVEVVELVAVEVVLEVGVPSGLVPWFVEEVDDELLEVELEVDDELLEVELDVEVDVAVELDVEVEVEVEVDVDVEVDVELEVEVELVVEVEVVLGPQHWPVLPISIPTHAPRKWPRRMLRPPRSSPLPSAQTSRV